MPRRMSPSQTEMLLKGLSKIFLAVAFFGLYFILFQVQFDKPLYVFFMLTLQHWLIFSLGLTFCVILDVAATHPELRFYFTHLEKKGQTLSYTPYTPQTVATTQKAVVRPEDQAEFDRLRKMYPHLFQGMLANQANVTTPQQNQQEKQKQKLPLF